MKKRELLARIERLGEEAAALSARVATLEDRVQYVVWPPPQLVKPYEITWTGTGACPPQDNVCEAFHA